MIYLVKIVFWAMLMAVMSSSFSESKCEFQGIFNFGDSNSDTGGFWAAFPAQSGPFGMTYFRKPAGRASDGRLIIDFLGSEKRRPPPDIFGKSVYTIYIGQNDFTSNSANLGVAGVKQFLSRVISRISYALKEIYGIGGRTFLVLNLAPVGCYPAFLVELPRQNSDLDEFGCMKSYNNAGVEYNQMLKDALAQTRKHLPGASVVYVDTYSVLLELFRHPKNHGLQYGTKACCGFGGGAYNFNPQIYCGNSKIVNGSRLTARACKDPYNYVSWDGIHTTEAANKLLTMAIVNGSIFDPPFLLHRHCDILPVV